MTSHLPCVVRSLDTSTFSAGIPSLRFGGISLSLQPPHHFRPGSVGTVTHEEKEQFTLIKERLRVLLEQQITNFRFCFPFGRPEGALKSTLMLMERVRCQSARSFGCLGVLIPRTSLSSDWRCWWRTWRLRSLRLKSAGSSKSVWRTRHSSTTSGCRNRRGSRPRPRTSKASCDRNRSVVVTFTVLTLDCERAAICRGSHRRGRDSAGPQTGGSHPPLWAVRRSAARERGILRGGEWSDEALSDVSSVEYCVPIEPNVPLSVPLPNYAEWRKNILWRCSSFFVPRRLSFKRQPLRSLGNGTALLSIRVHHTLGSFQSGSGKLVIFQFSVSSISPSLSIFPSFAQSYPIRFNSSQYQRCIFIKIPIKLCNIRVKSELNE